MSLWNLLFRHRRRQGDASLVRMACAPRWTEGVRPAKEGGEEKGPTAGGSGDLYSLYPTAPVVPPQVRYDWTLLAPIPNTFETKVRLEP